MQFQFFSYTTRIDQYLQNLREVSKRLEAQKKTFFSQQSVRNWRLPSQFKHLHLQRKVKLLCAKPKSPRDDAARYLPDPRPGSAGEERLKFLKAAALFRPIPFNKHPSGLPPAKCKGFPADSPYQAISFTHMPAQNPRCTDSATQSQH